MSKKLLNEAAVRRFMGLAGMNTNVVNNTVNEIYGGKPEGEEHKDKKEDGHMEEKMDHVDKDEGAHLEEVEHADEGHGEKEEGHKRLHQSDSAQNSDCKEGPR